MLIDTLSQLLGLVCISGMGAFLAVFSAAFLRRWLVERLATTAADSADE